MELKNLKNITKTNLSNKKITNVKMNDFYIDEKSKLIGYIILIDRTKEEEELLNKETELMDEYYMKNNIELTSCYDLQDKGNFRFIIFTYDTIKTNE